MPGKKVKRSSKDVFLKVPKAKLQELDEKLRKDIPDAEDEYPYEINKVLFAIDFALQALKLEKVPIA